MIAYLDTSAFVPLLIEEPSSEACQQLWDSADRIVSTRWLYVETTAALGQAHRLNRVAADGLTMCLAARDHYWTQMSIIELDGTLMAQAGRLAMSQELRGYDAVHCAAACMAGDPELVAGSGDKRLLEAWHNLGVATYDTTKD